MGTTSSEDAENAKIPPDATTDKIVLQESHTHQPGVEALAAPQQKEPENNSLKCEEKQGGDLENSTKNNESMIPEPKKDRAVESGSKDAEKAATDVVEARRSVFDSIGRLRKDSIKESKYLVDIAHQNNFFGEFDMNFINEEADFESIDKFTLGKNENEDEEETEKDEKEKEKVSIETYNIVSNSSSSSSSNITTPQLATDSAPQEPESEWSKRRKAKPTVKAKTISAPALTMPPLPEIQVHAESQDESDTANLDPENPLMKRIQNALLAQLSDAAEKLSTEIREKEEELKKAVTRREDIGVDLFSVQQRLKSMQRQSEETQKALAKLEKIRRCAEVEVKELRHQFDEGRVRHESHLKTLEARKNDLMKKTRELAQTQRFFDESKAKLAITRRIALKTDADLLNKEAEKRTQDFYVNSLITRSSRLKDEGETLSSQIEVQKRDIETSRQALQEANTEIEAIVFEKRQLYHEWKNSISSLQRRQEVIAQFESRNASEKETLQTMECDLNGFKKSLAAVSTEIENFSSLESRLNLEAQYVQEKIKSTEGRRENLLSECSMLQKTLEKSEEELKTLERDVTRLKNKKSTAEKQLREASQASNNLEKELAEKMQQQQSAEKDISGTSKDAKRRLQEIHEKEDVLAIKENQSAEMRIQCESVQSNLEGLQAYLKDLDRVISEKSATIDQYEIEIRKGNDDLAKKQADIDATSKKITAILAGSSIDALGPLEATIYNLAKAVAAKEKEAIDTQQFWVRNQNELVASSRRAGELADVIAEMRMRLAILTRKKSLLNKDFSNEESEIRYHQRNIKTLQNEMSKMSAHLSRQNAVQTQLEENNLGLEREFRHRLREAELESLKLERQVQDLKREKDLAVRSIIETERQIMLWEKKIQLAKETREALDPNIGAQELREMAAEIHRMELKLAQLQKDQETLVREMEKSISRRETIATQSRIRGSSYPMNLINKEIADITRKLKKAISEMKNLDQEMDMLNNAKSRIQGQSKEIAENMRTISQRRQGYVDDIAQLLDEKFLLSNEVTLLQKRKKRMDLLKAGKYAMLKFPAAATEENANEMRKKELANIQTLICKLEKGVESIMASNTEAVGQRSDSLRMYLRHARDLIM